MFRFCALLVFTMASLFATVAASAQDASVPPPPGIDDAGVTATPPAARSTPAPASSQHALKGIPELPAMGAGDVDRVQSDQQADHGNASGHEGRDALGEPPPTVHVRSVGQDKVEEYRIHGRLYMVHVIPAHGIPQTYMVNPDGKLQPEQGQAPVDPVMYTIYEWGKPKSKSSDDGK